MSGPGAAARQVAVAERLSVSFASRHGQVRAVRDVSLSLAAGECLAIVGESGAGKSVMARCLVGLAGPGARVAADRLAFGDTDLLALAGPQWRRLRGRRIGLVLQDALTSLDPLRRIRDEVAEPLQIHRLATRRDRDQQVLALLTDVGIADPAARASQYPHELSGGLRQRVLIASALAASPSLLIADEPTTALDVTIQAQVLDLLAAKKAAGETILLISHDLSVVARMADRIAVMYAGLIIEQGLAADILARPEHPYTAALLAAAPGLAALTGTDTARAGTGTAGGTAPARLPPAPGHALPGPAAGPGCPYASRCARRDDRCRAELPGMTDVAGGGSGWQVRCWHPGAVTGEAAAAPVMRRRPAGDVVVAAEHITKRFRSLDGSLRTAVDDVSFQLRAGEALGVVGESGSGKTTTAQIVLGLMPPDSGTVHLDGEPWSGRPERERRPRRSRIQVIYQDPLSSFDPRFTVERIIGEALGFPGGRKAAAHRARISQLLEAAGLSPAVLGRRGAELSGGERQRVAIARALAPGPEVIVCDEPVSALDVSVQAQILDLFVRLRADLGVALLFVSHDLDVIRQVCDRVIVMKDGSIVEEGPVDVVFSRPSHPYSRTLLEAATR